MAHMRHRNPKQVRRAKSQEHGAGPVQGCYKAACCCSTFPEAERQEEWSRNVCLVLALTSTQHQNVHTGAPSF